MVQNASEWFRMVVEKLILPQDLRNIFLRKLQPEIKFILGD
jgi:hypothetical protein